METLTMLGIVPVGERVRWRNIGDDDLVLLVVPPNQGGPNVRARRRRSLDEELAAEVRSCTEGLVLLPGALLRRLRLRRRDRRALRRVAPEALPATARILAPIAGSGVLDGEQTGVLGDLQYAVQLALHGELEIRPPTEPSRGRGDERCLEVFITHPGPWAREASLTGHVVLSDGLRARVRAGSLAVTTRRPGGPTLRWTIPPRSLQRLEIPERLLAKARHFTRGRPPAPRRRRRRRL